MTNIDKTKDNLSKLIKENSKLKIALNESDRVLSALFLDFQTNPTKESLDALIFTAKSKISEKNLFEKNSKKIKSLNSKISKKNL